MVAAAAWLGAMPAIAADTSPETREVITHFFVPASDRGSLGTQTVIGNSRAYTVKTGDTFLELARKFDLGYNELVAGNRGVDPWVPPEGSTIVLPTEWILPRAGHSGIVVNIPEMRLYYYMPSPRKGAKSSMVITYPVGLGRLDWQTPQADFRIRGKTENPTWVIPESIRAERARDLGKSEKSIPGGRADNPLGRHRIELTLPSYAIHGTNRSWGVGMQVSHGCVRLYPEDIAALFPLVLVGSPGRFTYEPVKIGVRRGRVMVEVHEDVYGLEPWPWLKARELVEEMGLGAYVDPQLLEAAVEAESGIPTDVSYVEWPEAELGEALEYDERGNLIEDGDNGENPGR